MTGRPRRGIMAASMLHARLHRLILPFCLALAAGTGAVRADPPAVEPATATGERDTAYQEFRRQFDAGRYGEALPHAERVVRLTEALDARHPDLASALNNLGATEYRLGDFVAAQRAYGRAVTLLEETHGSLSPRLIAPLRGLALTYQGTGRNEIAVPLLERAVSISRRSHGLFNPAQKDVLAPLVDGYAALARWKEANLAQQYSLQISEHQYGSNDPRLYPALQQLGRWYADTWQRNAAREIWERLRTLTADPAHPDPMGEIVALRGLAEAYRLDYQLGPEPVERVMGDLPPRIDPFNSEPGRRQASLLGMSFLAPEGREALEQALALAEHMRPPATVAMAVVLVDLGDWQLIAGETDRAFPYYTRALPLIPGDDGGAESRDGPLTRPGLLLYRQSSASTRYRDEPATLFVEKYAVAEFTVTAEGRVRDAKIVEGDATDSQRSSFLNAISHAIYRPRFVEGKPVATDGVRHRETFRQPKG